MNDFLTKLAGFTKEKGYNVIRYSEIIGDGDAETVSFGEANPCQNWYSVAKVFAMTGIGLLYDKGLVKLEDKVCDILRDWLPASGMDERWELSTVEMALTHRLGLPGGFLDIDTTRSTTFGEDYLQYMFTYPLVYTPGTDSKYSDGAFYLISCIVEKLSGMKLDDFIWKEVGLKLGYQEMAWSHCPRGHAMGATGLYLSSEDTAKLGSVYLCRGMYRGQRILSEEWVKNVFEKELALGPECGTDMYTKGGMFGQKLFIIPSQNRVVAMQSYGADSGAVAEWIAANGNSM